MTAGSVETREAKLASPSSATVVSWNMGTEQRGESNREGAVTNNRIFTA
jgi:hypothetical protein